MQGMKSATILVGGLQTLGKGSGGPFGGLSRSDYRKAWSKQIADMLYSTAREAVTSKCARFHV